LIAAAAVAAVGLAGVSGAPPLKTIAGDSVGAIDPANGISADVPLGSSPSSMAAGDGSLWVSNYNDNTVSRINPATHALMQTIPVDSTPSGIAFGDGDVWVANTFSGTLSRIDPTVDRVVGPPIAVGNGPSGVAVSDGSVWVTNSNDGTISRINAVTGVPGRPIWVGGSPTGIAADKWGVWVSDEPQGQVQGQVLRVDPATDQVTAMINVGNGPTAIAVGYGYIWVTNSIDDNVYQINPHTNEIVEAIKVGKGPNAIATGAGGVWVANEFSDTVSRINPYTDKVSRTIHVGSRPEGVAIVGGSPWVSAQASDTTHRGGTLTLLTRFPFDTDDPANIGSEYASALTLYMTNDGLTAFKRVGGSDGLQVVPDLAVSLPAPTDNGLTYSFQLHRGIRYSNGQLVRPEDFQWAIERGFRLRDYGYLQYFESLVGGAACVARPARCDLKQGIVPNDKEDTVTFHLVAPDAEFLKRLATVYAVAVPTGTPVESSYNLPHPLPATGPYEIARYSPAHEVVLVRNPYFHVWSPAARPDGYPDRIIWKIGASPSEAVTAVEQGRADYMVDPPPAGRLFQIATRFASQLNAYPNDFTAALFLNTRVAPFNDVRVRQALNYAVDRREVARLIGLDSTPTCELIPPYVPGYQRYCPYNLDPLTSGFDKARSLIAESHTRGMTITIWSQPAYGIDYTSTGRYFVSLLDRLGYRAHLRTFAFTDSSFGNFAFPRTRAQAAFWTAVAAVPVPSEFIDFLLGCQYIAGSSPGWWGSNSSEFCSRRLEATIRRAYAAEEANSPTATALWETAARQATDAAPLVPLATPDELDFVSRRVGNYQYNPAQGILLDQVWVR
jgi:peptide/nickel transport system substrate-binding protein